MHLRFALMARISSPNYVVMVVVVMMTMTMTMMTMIGKDTQHM